MIKDATDLHLFLDPNLCVLWLRDCLVPRMVWYCRNRHMGLNPDTAICQLCELGQETRFSLLPYHKTDNNSGQDTEFL